MASLGRSARPTPIPNAYSIDSNKTVAAPTVGNAAVPKTTPVVR